MGYTTDFEGSLKISRPLTKKQTEYINLINQTRRMKRDVNKLMKLYKGKHGNPFAKDKTPEAIYGREGEYFAKDDGNCGQSGDDSIINYNVPPTGVPGLWCGWCITEDGMFLEWDGGEKFYNYVEWLEYLIKHFFQPWGRKLNGKIEWFGEDRTDIGAIVVKNNKVTTKVGVVIYK